MSENTYTVVEAIASSFAAMTNCEERDNLEWGRKHRAAIQYLLDNHMPSGAGFDSGTKFDYDRSSTERLVFSTSFHHMDDNGYYCGWTDHEVFVTPSFVFTLGIRVTGKNERDIKEYIADTFVHYLTTVLTQKEYNEAYNG